MTPHAFDKRRIEVIQKAERDAVAAFKERLKEKVNAEIEKLERQQRDTSSPDGYISYITIINSYRGFLTLIDQT